MRKFLCLCMLITMVSCAVEQNTPVTPANDTFDESSATVLSQGMLIGIGGHTASGTVTIYDDNGKKFVVLDPYSSQNGPDLKVYLSKNVSAISYINLGGLRSIAGKQVYPVPGNPDINDYPYVHIWCEQYSVEFGRAELH
jgi:hypothetical protein